MRQHDKHRISFFFSKYSLFKFMINKLLKFIVYTFYFIFGTQSKEEFILTIRHLI